MQICVVGLGKIGLPLAVQFANKGHQVIGADVDERVVELVNAGAEPFPGETDLDVLLKDVVGRKHLRATTDTTDAVALVDVVVVVVPLFVDSDGVPDFGWMEAATRSIAAGLRPRTLVSYETTLPVGTTRDRWGPLLQEGSGLTPGRDFALVFSPERVLTGRVFADLRRYSKLVGGIDEESARRGTAFYEAVLDFDSRNDLPRPNGVWDLGSAEAAELAKLAETTYRDVNIGLANQFARYAQGLDVDITTVIEACNTQPYSHIHQPGIAVGGHCIPVYPRLYLWNDPQPRLSAPRARPTLPCQSTPSIFWPQRTATSRERPCSSWAPPTVEASRRRHSPACSRPSRPWTHAARSRTSPTPLYTAAELTSLGLAPHGNQAVTAAVVQADHAEYRTMSSADLPSIRVLVDGRRVTDPKLWRGVHRVVIGG